MEEIKNLIEDVAIANFCENNIDQYYRYLDRDIENLKELKEKAEYEEELCLCNH